VRRWRHREQAFLDNARDRFRADAAYAPGRRQAAREFYATIPSIGELQFRYRRICLLARGYQLTPLEEGEEQDRTEDVD
jgi:hypothetical protein